MTALPMFEAEAKKRQGTRTDIVVSVSEGSRSRRAVDDVAKVVGVSPTYVSMAKRVTEEAEV